MTFPKKPTLVAWSPTIQGEGSELHVEFEAFRESRRGGDWLWRGKIRLKIDRHVIREISLAIDEMQKRDRERLAREYQRLLFEVAPVQRPEG